RYRLAASDRRWSARTCRHRPRGLDARSSKRLIQGAGNLTAKALCDASASVGDEADLSALTRFETNRRARRNIEALTAGRLAFEGERGIDLVEMVVRADLDGPVAAVGDNEGDRRTAGIDLDLVGCWHDLSGYHGAAQRIGS